MRNDIKPSMAKLFFSISILSFFCFIAILSFFWTPYPSQKMDILIKLTPPNLTHWFGTDQYGRDILSMMMVGSSHSLQVALAGVFMGAILGVPLGLLASQRSFGIDCLIIRLSDIVFAFPALLTAVLLTAIWGPSNLNIILAIGIFSIPVFMRMTKSSAQIIWKQNYILAAQMSGRCNMAISFYHVLPNLSGILLVQISLQLAIAILSEAGLSYMGLGAPPPASSWGRMLAEAQTYLFNAPHLVFFPGLAIALCVISFNLLGDSLRDYINPHLHVVTKKSQFV